MIDPLSMIGGQQATDLGRRHSTSASKGAPVRHHRPAGVHGTVVARRRRSAARLLHAVADVVGGKRRELATEPC